MWMKLLALSQIRGIKRDNPNAPAHVGMISIDEHNGLDRGTHWLPLLELGAHRLDRANEITKQKAIGENRKHPNRVVSLMEKTSTPNEKICVAVPGYREGAVAYFVEQ